MAHSVVGKQKVVGSNSSYTLPFYFKKIITICFFLANDSTSKPDQIRLWSQFFPVRPPVWSVFFNYIWNYWWLSQLISSFSPSKYFFLMCVRGWSKRELTEAELFSQSTENQHRLLAGVISSWSCTRHRLSIPQIAAERSRCAHPLQITQADQPLCCIDARDPWAAC